MSLASHAASSRVIWRSEPYDAASGCRCSATSGTGLRASLATKAS